MIGVLLSVYVLITIINLIILYFIGLVYVLRIASYCIFCGYCEWRISIKIPLSELASEMLKRRQSERLVKFVLRGGNSF